MDFPSHRTSKHIKSLRNSIQTPGECFYPTVMGSVVKKARFRPGLPPLKIKTSLSSPTQAYLLRLHLQETLPRQRGHLITSNARSTTPEARRECGGESASQARQTTRSPRNKGPRPAAHTQTQRSKGKPLTSLYSTILSTPQSPPGAAGGEAEREEETVERPRSFSTPVSDSP